MRIDRFCTQLQAGANVPTITESETGEISCPVSLPSNYVMPNIAPGTLVPAARVILIEAPGAVGKSMAARAMAAMLGWPLVLSNRAQVGSYTLTGMLQDRMGFDSDFLPSLARGETGIVIDAIDEAHLRAGTNNLLAFLEDVKRLTPPREAMASPSIIILGRVDAIDLVSLALDEMNVPYDRQRLAYFGRREATDFVREYLKLRADETGQPEYRTAQASPTPFEKLLNQRMQEVGSLLVPGVDVVNAWGTVEDFLGYAALRR
ncbi:MAG: hypothetical protein IPM00_12565 [Tetrasphaera sp.]|nr:hypothetical protein [Tetrasphaera sp.]